MDEMLMTRPHPRAAILGMNSRHSRSAGDVDLVGVTPLLRRLLSPRLRVRIASCVVHDDVDVFGELVEAPRTARRS